MGAGLRDAMNLAWKLAGVLGGNLPESVLDTYELERKPHARALIRLAKLVGVTMTEGGRLGNLVRSLLAPRLHLIPGVKQLVLNSQTPPMRRSDLVHRPPLRGSSAGKLCPNTALDDGRRFDDVAPGRFSVVTTTAPSAEHHTEIDKRGAALVVAGPGTELHRWLRRGGAHAAIVRPDGTVLRAGRDLTSVCVYLPAFHPIRRTPTEELSGNRVTEASRGLLASGGEAAVEGHLKELRAGFQRIIQRRWPARVVEARDRQGDASEGGLLVGEVAASHDHAHQLEYGRSGSIMVRK